MLGWKKHKLESKLLGETSITSDMQMIPPFTPPFTESKEELKSLKFGFKFNIQKNKIMHLVPSLHANRWGNSGNSGWLYFFLVPASLQMVIAAMKLKDAYSLEGKLWPI